MFESVIVQKYLPGPRLEIVSVYKLSLFILFVHKYVNGAIPPEILARSEPSLAPLQLILSTIWRVNIVGLG